MYPVGDEFLSGPACTGNQHRIIGGGITSDKLKHFQERRALPQDNPLTPYYIQRLLQGLGFFYAVVVKDGICQGG